MKGMVGGSVSSLCGLWARSIIAKLITRYNTEWHIGRVGYRTPADARTKAWAEAA